MRQFLLATALVAGAVGAFFGGRILLTPAATAPLGDMTGFSAIVADVQAIARGGDLAAAATRVTDLETAWDEAEAVMRPKNPEDWGRVDGATDDALSALRATTPDPVEVDANLVALQAVLADPSQGETSVGGVLMIGDVAVTDGAGHSLPCEAMLTEVKARQAAVTPEAAAKADDLVAKATERCNADDDKTADSFSAEALAALAG